MQPSPVISIIGVMHSENEVEITSVMRVNAVPEVPNGIVTDLTAEIIGEKGNVAGRAKVYRLRSHGDSGCGCCGEGEHPEDRYPFVFQAFIPDTERGSALRIRQGEKEMWSRKAPEGEPRISSLKARMSKGRFSARWSFKGQRGEEGEYWVQWSNDEGKTWHALTSGLRRGEVELDLSAGPSGKVLVRVMGSDGFHTTASEPVSVEFPEREAAVSILSPRNEQTLVAGSPMRLWGAASSGSGEPLESYEARWILDGEPAADGLDAFIQAPGEGEHKLTLLVTAENTRAEQTVVFRTVAIPDVNQGTE